MLHYQFCTGLLLSSFDCQGFPFPVATFIHLYRFMPKIGGHPSCLRVRAGVHAGRYQLIAGPTDSIPSNIQSLLQSISLAIHRSLQIHVFGLWKGAMAPGESQTKQKSPLGF